MANKLTDLQRAEIVERKARGETLNAIAKAVGCNPSTVQRVCAGLRSTALAARAHYEAASLELAQRVTEQANVSQILEIHDRLDVLPAKREPGGKGPGLVVVVGMPGAPALQPPSQAKIEAAKGPSAGAQALAKAIDV